MDQCSVLSSLTEDKKQLATLDVKAAFAKWAQVLISEGASHPFITGLTVWLYGGLTGEIYMMMDEDEYLLKAGDVVVLWA